MDPALHALTDQYWYWSLFFFIYGLSFFLMGFGILIRSRWGSNLSLGRRLPSLAVFGLLHGATEWGYIFIPARVVAEGWQTLRGALLTGGHALLLALSYTFLLAFGLNLMVDTRNWPGWVRTLPAVFLGGWGLIFFLTFPGGGAATGPWLVSGDVTARYLLAVPGSILSALAILAQVEELARLRRRSLRFCLIGSAMALFLYTFAGGLMVPPASFFPANVLNTGLLMSLGLPAPVLRILSSVLVAYFIFRLLEVYDAEEQRYRETVREREMIWREREKIRRDLHDGVIQSIYGLALGLEHSRNLLADNPAAAADRLKVLTGQAEGIINDLRGYLAGLHLGRELPADPVAIIKEQVINLARGTELEIKWQIKGAAQGGLDSEQRDHLYHMVAEICSNIRRHARASRVRVQVDLGGEGFKVTIKDNGTGLLGTVPDHGQGLINLRQRAALAGGWLEIASSPGRGTTVTFWLPYSIGGGREGDGHSRCAGR
ncbi:sensor histidine kinase [Neomoorella thermoacetica]|uniref:sensor histidine kinase n=1 Tax=Neomoorella thermoacetica TaxID=1525 RepID=UPI0008FB8AF3|nr:ATP-binding protein [Moorella thermoacetica]OIQ62332.1 sensor histidine kinase LiaS [Moorella thermoacetica]